MISVFDVFFPQLSNDVGSFFEISIFIFKTSFTFYFSQKTYQALFGKYPLLRKKWSAFDLEVKKIKNTLFEIYVLYFLKVKMKFFGKTAYVIRKLRKKYVENVYKTIF